MECLLSLLTAAILSIADLPAFCSEFEVRGPDGSPEDVKDMAVAEATDASLLRLGGFSGPDTPDDAGIAG